MTMLIKYDTFTEDVTRFYIAECVLASRPESPDSPEFITGLRLDEDDQKNWFENPIFQHLVVKSVSSEIASSKGKGGVMIKAQLLGATSSEEVFEIIKGT